MSCKKCRIKPVFTLSGGETLCKKCFIDYVERKAKWAIRQFEMFNHAKNVAVALSGGKDSTAVLHLIHKLQAEKKHFKLFAILIDEGIKGYREFTIKAAKRYCKQHNIELHIYSFKDNFGVTLDSLAKKTERNPCSVCGVLRRWLLNKAAKELKADILVTGHNADDEAQSIVMNLFKNNNEAAARLGPVTGVCKDKKFVQRVKPFYFLLEKEITAYAFLNKLLDDLHECPYATKSYRGEIRDMLNEFEARHSGTKTGIINSFVGLLPLLKQKYKTNKGIEECPKCHQATAKGLCKACNLLEALKKAKCI